MPSKSNVKSNVNSNLNPIMSSFKTSPVIDKYSPLVGFTIVGYIANLIIITFILNWLNKIKHCKCANLPERKFLPEWFSFFTIWIIFILIIYIAYGANPSKYPIFITVLSIIVGIVHLAMIIRLFIYIRRLREINCDCGLSQEENIIYYYTIIFFGILGFVILMLLFGQLFGMTSK
jgi:hypothetical protein